MFKNLIKKLRKKQIFGWRPAWFEGGFISVAEQFEGSTASLVVDGVEFSGGSKKKEDKRKEVKPKDVMNELAGKSPDLDFTNLKEKIKAIKKRRDFIVDDLGLRAEEENQALIWLTARKKGAKLLEKFIWPVTTQEKVNQLLSKYKLTRATINQYHLALPEEAIDEMEKFVSLWKKVTKAKPEFVILADIVKEKTKRRDPILLASSPFGAYFFVLGAWDKEVQIMHELFFVEEK